MRILQVINSLKTGGAEKLIIDSVPFYQKKGLDVDVLLLNDNPSDFRHILEQKTRGNVFGLTKYSVYNPFLIFKIIPFLNNYNVIHVHLFPALYWVVLATSLSNSKTKVIYTEHNTHNRRRNKSLFKIIDKIIYKKLSRIITISDEVDYRIKDHLKFDNMSRFQLINNGVDISKFANSKPLSKSIFFTNDDYLLIQVSSFREQKDQPTLIKAMKFLPENVKLLLVGEGSLKALNEKLSEELGLSNRIKFLGNRNDIPELLKTVDIVILSSYHEGMSLSSIEGMAVKPFIASNVPGLKEVVGGYGLLFDQGDSKGLAEKVMSLISNQKYYNEISDKCADRAKEFDLDKMTDQYVDVYSSICNL